MRTSRAYEPVRGPCSIRAMIPFNMAGRKRVSIEPPTIQFRNTSFPPQSKSITCVSRTLILYS
ncbi:hypothetical protein Barb7_02496 [Bacteroidales bacterium Barb7]|nr:hypothetical protein Barb7_02496 [Bacteroidales bacterium Barb7]